MAANLRLHDPKLVPKLVMTRLGRRCTGGLVYNLNGMFNYLHVGWWLRAHGYEPERRFWSREEMFDWVAADVADREVLYLEFGVHEGDSIRYWSRLLRNPRSHLHGFDSFVGLPHDWTLEGHERGYFSTGGAVPEIDDPRVEFFAGWFDETLPHYEWPAYDVLVVMLDADLYTSTATVLSSIEDKLEPGTYLYFDQFHHRGDELRAFAEFLDERDVAFRLVALTQDHKCVLFRRV